ncbi:hypothetical protein CMUS01_08368 [Colletotrichum musicola]|uniref:Uncharacterized protein n=1 Tax=Colletotrichum musicola TaxID=2175873 RepID=A0A8H6KDC2_9PEZI|nr:hypothetical protein CMUS01_08368 [Colletotrichum musicola]
MGDERDIASITLQLLAKADEITVKEQSKMPSATLTSRLRSGNNGSKASSGEPSSASSTTSSYHIPDDVLAWSESRQAARGRPKQAMDANPDIATKQHTSIRHGVHLPITQPQQSQPTEVMRRVSPLAVLRPWNPRLDLAAPDASQPHVAEAIMVHERGEVQHPDNRCPRCRRGEGISPDCVKIPGIHGGTCSNCLMARCPGRSAAPPRPVRSYSAERRSISAAMAPSTPKEDLIAVWNLIAGVVAAQPRECFFEDEAEETPGKRIEDAARLVARSAEEWGHTIRDGDGDGGRTPSERSRLVRQAARIRETALQIADCARDWGEKLERKRSTSRLRT